MIDLYCTVLLYEMHWSSEKNKTTSANGLSPKQPARKTRQKMTAGAPDPPPDPRGGNASTIADLANATRQAIPPRTRPSTSNQPPPSSLPPTPALATPSRSQTRGRMVVKDLVAFEAGRAGRATKSRKRRASAGRDDRPGRARRPHLLRL